MGDKGACPLMLPPPLGGEWGAPSQFPRQLKKLEGISAEPFFNEGKQGFLYPVYWLFLFDLWKV